MGQNTSLNKSVILYEIAQNLIKKKIQNDINNNSGDYHEVKTDLNINQLILENEKLKESIKQKSDEIEILRKELKIYTSSSEQFQNQTQQLDFQSIQDVRQIIHSNQIKLLNLLEEQGTPKNFVNDDEKLNLNCGKISKDDLSQQILKQEIENLFSEMKMAIESMLKNQLKRLTLQDLQGDFQSKCKINDAYLDNTMQKEVQAANNQQISLKCYQKKELNAFNHINQKADLNQDSPQNQNKENLAKPQKQKLIKKKTSSCQQLVINEQASGQNFIQKENDNKANIEIKYKSQTYFGNRHSKETADCDVLFQEENSSKSDLKKSEAKVSETSISVTENTSSNSEIQNSVSVSSRGESDFERILMKVKLEEQKQEINEAMVEIKNKKDTQKFNNIISHNEGQYHKQFRTRTENTLQEKQEGEGLIKFNKKNCKNSQNKRQNSIIFSRSPTKKFSNISQKSFFFLENQEKIKLQSQKELSPSHIHNSQNDISCMDFYQAKANTEIQKVIDQVDENNFFSDEVVKYSSNRKPEKKIIVLNSIYFYVLSQDQQEKHKQFLIEDISKIVVCPNNKQLCSVQIKKQFQLIIEVPHINFFIKHIQNHFKNILKKNSPEVRIQMTAIQTNNSQQSDVIAQKFLEQQRSKQELKNSQSDQKIQLKTDSAQMNLCSQKNHYFKAFIVKNPSKQLQQISNENWVEGFLILQTNKSDSAAVESIFQRVDKLEVQAEADCFISNQKIFQFIDKESNHYLIKLKQDFDIPILNKNVNSGYKQYLSLYNCLNS
ncbi:hypothetical protein ABPG74_005066 [Tetrahymena malaccensis]